ncbi:hypothetical protein DEA8626_00805 [Defluviimonas aquaemixtae]|uniref:Putative Flp pilus-assembly TadG-like N-terminal domain-containing protein n=1 Tax=Albidovulum aquaemixtae TaxID=1542388 RepID=A0A2R8B3V1_9RHOB|nr:hypothetical protein DEA8626_00805 [Defluviimonas aquaemixtae]
MLIFGLFAFIMMLMLAGVSLDLMRFEERRTLLQNTIDRAALAAADLQQSLQPKEVVKDYFRKAGLKPPADEDIIVTEGNFGTSRKVKINVSEQMDTWFMKLVGVNEMSTPAASTAEESIGQVEISLILDVSGSMNSNNRLTNLKPAAKSFVDQIFDSTEEGKVSISIVPYATQVSISDDLAGYFDITGEHTYSTCIEFRDDAGDFDTTAITLAGSTPARTYQQNAHFDPFYRASPPVLTNCPDNATQSNRQVLPFSGDRDALKTYIDALSAAGNTSIDIGMKWGAALLDPSMQPVVDGMIAAGSLPGSFGERPYAYDDGDALKIIVLMTDGANTTEYRIRNSDDQNPSYEEGLSPLHRNSYYQENSSSSDDFSLNQYSLWDESRGKYYVFRHDIWRNEPYGAKPGDYGYDTPAGSGSKDHHMEWQEVWSTMSVYYFADYIIKDAYDSNWLRNQWRPGSVSDPIATQWIRYEKDARTLDVCDAAKLDSRKIKIYTIAFEAPTQGQNLLQSCASSDSNYYNVAGLDIQEAFSGIVNSINKLRLTH